MRCQKTFTYKLFWANLLSSVDEYFAHINGPVGLDSFIRPQVSLVWDWCHPYVLCRFSNNLYRSTDNLTKVSGKVIEKGNKEKKGEKENKVDYYFSFVLPMTHHQS